MLIGTYEQACVPWSERETPWDFGQNLLPNDLDRIAPSLDTAFEHFPELGKAGIRKVVNGPFTFAPDGNPLVGPIKGLKNFWVACGVMAGFSQGGGVGLALSNWMIEGDPDFGHVELERSAPDDVVLVAGKGHEDYQIVGTVRRAFRDQDVVAAELTRLPA